MTVAKSKLEEQREKKKFSKLSDAIAQSVRGESSDSCIDIDRTHFCYVAEEIMKEPAFKSDLVMGMASFVYSTLFVLPRLQAIETYARFSRFLVHEVACRER